MYGRGLWILIKVGHPSNKFVIWNWNWNWFFKKNEMKFALNLYFFFGGGDFHSFLFTFNPWLFNFKFLKVHGGAGGRGRQHLCRAVIVPSYTNIKIHPMGWLPSLIQTSRSAPWSDALFEANSCTLSVVTQIVSSYGTIFPSSFLSSSPLLFFSFQTLWEEPKLTLLSFIQKAILNQFDF